MSYEELDRVRVIERVIEKRLTQREAARILGLTSHQVRRLRRVYEQDGARALASKHRGRSSNRRLPAGLRREALATVRSRYEGSTQLTRQRAREWRRRTKGPGWRFR